MNTIQKLIQENFSEPKTITEQEITLYAYIGNFSGLNQASAFETHEQCEIKDPNKKGKFRVRLTGKGNRPNIVDSKLIYPNEEVIKDYTLTIKIPNNKENIDSSLEVENSITKDAFDAMKIIADKQTVKHRYNFKTNKVTVNNEQTNLFELIWEVDVYPNDEGSYHPWCKIDLEINTLLDKLSDDVQYKLNIKPSSLPLELSQIIEGSSQSQTDKDKITELYDKYFLTTTKA